MSTSRVSPPKVAVNIPHRPQPTKWTSPGRHEQAHSRGHGAAPFSPHR